MFECKIAEKLAELRASRGLTQEEVARRLFVSNKTLSKWENGSSTPDYSMLAEISKYYGVTTDYLLGLSDEKKKTTREEIGSLFYGLDHGESVLKAFETVRALVPIMCEKAAEYSYGVDDKKDNFPMGQSGYYRSKISTGGLFEFTARNENVNLAVMLLKNKADFSWMNDKDKQAETVRLFKFLSSEDTLSVLYFIHSAGCSKSFTADYISKNTGINEERVTEILNEFCAVGACHWVTAHLTEGEVRVYESKGDGLILSLISLAFERMCGSPSYDYNYNGSCKMIGGR